MTETPIQRLQREVTELRSLFGESLDVLHKCVQGVAALNDLDGLRALDNQAAHERLDGRCDALMLILRAMQTEPAEVAERALRSVDDE